MRRAVLKGDPQILVLERRAVEALEIRSRTARVHRAAGAQRRAATVLSQQEVSLDTRIEFWEVGQT